MTCYGHGGRRKATPERMTNQGDIISNSAIHLLRQKHSLIVLISFPSKGLTNIRVPVFARTGSLKGQHGFLIDVGF